MADDNDIIVRLRVDGVNKFKTDLTQTSNAIEGVDTDVKELYSTLDQAKTKLSGMKEGSKAFNELSKEIKATEIAMNTTATSMENAKTKLRAMQQQIVNSTFALKEMEKAGLKGTQQFKVLESEIKKMTNSAGELKDTIGDVAETVRNAGSDTRGIDNALRAVTSLTAGFQVVQGASALFGKDSEELQKTLVKLNAVMSITQGLQQIQAELMRNDSIFTLAAAKAKQIYATASNFVNNGLSSSASTTKAASKSTLELSDAVKSTATGTTLLTTAQKAHETATKSSTAATLTNTGAMYSSSVAAKVLRLALLSIGIGFLVIGISALISNWGKLKESIFGVTQSLEDFRKKQEQIRTETQKGFDDYETEIKYLVNIKKLTQEAADVKLSAKRRETEERLKDIFDENKQKLNEYEQAIKAVSFAKEDGLTLSELEAVRAQQKYIPSQKELTEQKRITTEAEIDYKRAVNDRIEAEEKGIEKTKKLKEIKSEKLKQDIEELKTLDSYDKNSQRAILAQIEWYQFLASSIDIASQEFRDLNELIDLLKKKLAGKQKVEIDVTNALNGLKKIDIQGKPLTLFDRIFGTKAENETRLQEMQRMAEGALKISDQLFSYGNQIANIATQAIAISTQNQLNLLQEKKDKGLITEKEFERKSAEIKTEAARKERAAQIAQAVAQIPIAILTAFISGSKISPIVGGILAGIAGAFATAQVALLAAAPLPKFKEGGHVGKRLGLIKGRSHAQGGVPIEVEGNEYVMTTQAVKKYGVNFMEEINNMKFNPIVQSGNKLKMKSDKEYRMNENLATMASYLKQVYKTDAQGNIILTQIRDNIAKNKQVYV